MNIEGFYYVVVLMLTWGVLWFLMTKNQIIVLKIEKGKTAEIKTIEQK